MEYLVAILQPRPLTLHFSLHNPRQHNTVVNVPRVLAPLGLFVSIEVLDRAGKVVYETSRPKARWKLDPAQAESYQALQPGYSFGVVLVASNLDVPDGDYRLRLAYSNRPYVGTPDCPVGELSFKTTLPFTAG